ncbi:MAG: translation elongation factor G [Deltaproteobacteria bacterium RBG_13_52_11]|nr:MAG: translation elongation factor G [Deltaproteobacteria bacterium RBG_13_52_11]
MKKYEVEKIRNVGIFGHGSDGKTSLADTILFDTGMNNRIGRVDDGSSILDFEPEEINRQISISAALAYYEWDKHRVVLIDTPGDANFIFDAKACMRVVEGGIIVIGANAGVKVQTEAVWTEASTLQLPRIIFISKMDAERARFAETLDDIRERLSSPQPLPLQIPIGKEKDFQGVIDLLSNKAYIYEGDATGKYREEAIPQELVGEAQQRRVKTIETLVEMDDALMEKYLEGAEISLVDLQQCLKKGTIEGRFAPVVCGSSIKNIGIHPLLNVINACLPSPAEVAPRKGKNPRTGEEEKREAKEDAPFSAYVFKTIADPFAGRLTLFRVFSGGISADTTLYNSTKDAKERVGQIFMLLGKKQEPVGFAGPGDIVAVAKLKETTTGDTLCNEKNPIVFEGASPPPAMISFAIRPKAKGDDEKIATSLPKLMEEDPTITISRDLQTKEIILSCMGQVHVDVVLEKLKRKFGVEVDLDVPKVPYKETIKKSVKEVVYRHKKQTGGRGQFAEVHFDISPLERGKGFEFQNALTGMNVPRNFVPAVEKGIAEAITSGVLAGYPVVDVKVRFYDGKSHEVDSSEMAFKIASIMGFKKGIREANPIFLEPIMKIEIVAPEDHVGDVIGDLNGRRGRILGVEAKGHSQIVRANVPMAEVLRYAPDLTSMTGGKGSFTLEYSHYEEVPANISERMIAGAQKEKEEE